MCSCSSATGAGMEKFIFMIFLTNLVDNMLDLFLLISVSLHGNTSNVMVIRLIRLALGLSASVRS